MSVSAGQRLGPYEVVARLGVGGMGEVYRARDPRLERTVAIKILLPQLAGERRVPPALPARGPGSLCALASEHRAHLRRWRAGRHPFHRDGVPFAGDTANQTIDRICHAVPAPITGLNRKAPEALQRIVAKCLEKDWGGYATRRRAT